MKQQFKPEEREEVLRRVARSASFQRTFKGKDGELVLAELKSQLRGFDSDPYVHAYNAGVRSIYEFIQTVLNEDVERAREMLGTEKKK